jgi:hypothetical protein
LASVGEDRGRLASWSRTPLALIAVRSVIWPSGPRQTAWPFAVSWAAACRVVVGGREVEDVAGGLVGAGDVERGGSGVDGDLVHGRVGGQFWWRSLVRRRPVRWAAWLSVRSQVAMRTSAASMARAEARWTASSPRRPCSAARSPAVRARGSSMPMT